MALAPPSDGRGRLGPPPDDLSGFIDHEFSKTGLRLSSALWHILDQALATNFDAAPVPLQSSHSAGGDDQQPVMWLSKLCEWREVVGFAALELINIINEEVGCGNHENDYCNTKSFSIYMWWRICKMVADIDVVAGPSNRTDIEQLHEYFDYMKDLFLELWMGLIITLERDVRIIRLTEGGQKGKMSQIIPESSGTFRTIQDPDMFPDVDPGNDDQSEQQFNESKDISSHVLLQVLLYHATPVSSDLALKSCAKKIVSKLSLFFSQSPISCEDFAVIATILFAHASLKVEFQKAKLPRRLNELPRRFKKWRDAVRDAVNTPEIDRQVTHIYQQLMESSSHPNIRALCHALRDLLVNTPELFRAFELLVPHSYLAEWRVKSHRIQTEQKHLPDESTKTSHNEEQQPQGLQSFMHLRGGGSADFMDELKYSLHKSNELFVHAVQILEERYLEIGKDWKNMPLEAMQSLRLQCDGIARKLIAEDAADPPFYTKNARKVVDDMVKTAMQAAQPAAAVVPDPVIHCKTGCQPVSMEFQHCNVNQTINNNPNDDQTTNDSPNINQSIDGNPMVIIDEMRHW